MSDKTLLSKYLRRLRQAKNESLRDVERDTGISNAYLSQLERGKASRPSPDKLHALADHYNVPYEELMRAAGYIKDTSGEQKKDFSSFESALMSADLSEEEEEMVLKFIKTLRSE